MFSPRYFTLFFTYICLSNNALAQGEKQKNEFSVQCPLLTYEKLSEIQSAENDKSIIITSKKSQIVKDQFAKFTGGVTLVNNSETITADEIEINRASSLINAQGDIHFQNEAINIFASKLNASEADKTTQLNDTSYQLTNNPGHGSAKLISVNEKGSLTLVDSSYTTCYGEKPDWLMQASEIKISAENKQLEAYNVRFKLFDVPVLYIPYFSIPITNERQSGILYSTINSNKKSGIEVTVPYYWNISENIDATITTRYMSKRGTQLQTEYRYLSDLQSGMVNLEYLDKDELLVENIDARYLARLQHVGNFSDRFRAYIDYTTVSDDNYLIDLGSAQYNSNDTYLYQIGELSYFGDDWRATIQVQDFEVLGSHTPSYKTEPHVEISSQQVLPFSNATFDLYSELTRFVTTDKNLPDAQRYHVEAGITLPISTPSWFINSELKLLQTNYHQENIPVGSLLKENISRTLPKFRLHGGINFDKQLTYQGKSYTQTLEPQMQYLYIPDKDQSNIGVYDTTTLQDDYNGLFRDKRFSGLDRIAQANQYSWGVTSRLLNKENQELFRLSLGRIVYLKGNNNVINEAQNISTVESALASEVYLRLNRKWPFTTDIQYDTDTGTTNKSQSNIDYQFSENQTIQLNHRYTRDVSGIRIEQVSLLGNVILNENWQVVARLTQDLQQKRSLESYLGMQYNSCWWGIRLSYHRHINSNLEEQNSNNNNRDAFDNGFKIQFVYNGMSGKRSPNSIADMFNSSIFGYKRPYFLNN
jgi:LPS-assembly protein